MIKEDLIEYKAKLSKLSEEEKKLREMYLRKMSLGEIQGPMTGYPSIDKTCLGIYKEEEYFSEKPKETVTEALFKNNANNLDTTALEYFGGKISYGKFENNIKELVKSLNKYGVKKGDYVSVCLLGMPEAMTSFYSNGYLGASTIFLAPYLDIDTMISDIKKNNSKILFILDMFYEKGKEKFDKVIEECGIEKVVVVPILNSSILGKVKKNKKLENDKFIYYNDFIKEGKNTELPEMVKYEEDMPVAVVYSSGTTGVLKGVLLSHDSVNNLSIAYTAFGFDLSGGQSVYQAIPVWSSTGLVAVGTVPLYFGATLHENPKFEPDVFSENIGKYKDNWGIATTELFNGLSNIKDKPSFKLKKRLKILDYSKLHTVLIGGTFASPNDKKRLNEIFKEIGSPARANSGYGTCENGSTVCAELNHIDYPDYSIGHPIPGATVIAIDKDCNELQYGQRGELAVKTNCGMLRYYNRPDLDGIFFKDKGSDDVYKHTGDIGYVLPNGTVIYEGRGNDISIINGEQLYNFDVKRELLNDKDIFDCEVFINPNGKLCANIVFKEKDNVDIESKLVELQQKIYDVYNNINYVPIDFKIRDSFPMASSTKRDYKSIKEEKEGYIELNFTPNKQLKKSY